MNSGNTQAEDPHVSGGGLLHLNIHNQCNRNCLGSSGLLTREQCTLGTPLVPTMGSTNSLHPSGNSGVKVWLIGHAISRGVPYTGCISNRRLSKIVGW